MNGWCWGCIWWQKFPQCVLKAFLWCPWDLSWEEEPLSAHCGLPGEKALTFCDYNVPRESKDVEFHCCFRTEQGLQIEQWTLEVKTQCFILNIPFTVPSLFQFLWPSQPMPQLPPRTALGSPAWPAFLSDTPKPTAVPKNPPRATSPEAQ